MMDNDAIIRCTRDILDECFTNFISGIWPSDDVHEDEIGLWFCQMAGEMLTVAFLENDNMTIEDAIEVGKKLTRLIAFDSEKNSENYKLEFQEYYHLRDEPELPQEAQVSDERWSQEIKEVLSKYPGGVQFPPSNNGSFSNG